jgi:hypothetical protein
MRFVLTRRHSMRSVDRDPGQLGRMCPSGSFQRNGKLTKPYVRAWKAACKAAGHEGRLVHDLRRFAVRNLEPRCGSEPSR